MVRNYYRISTLLGLMFCFVLLAKTGPATADAPPLKFGIMPFNSALALIRSHQPLTQHLEQTLGRKIQVLSSTDYFTHINQVLAGDFDLLITGPHFAVMATEKSYLPLVRYAADLRPGFVVRQDSPWQSEQDLRGKRIGMPSRLAVISSSGIKWLADQGLRLNNDYQVVEFVSHGAAVAAVASGEVDLALTASSAWGQVPEGIRSKTRMLPTDIRLPHLMTLAHKRLPKPEIERVRQALMSFGDTPAGKAFFRSTEYQGYAPVTAQDLEKLRPYVELTVKLMR